MRLPASATSVTSRVWPGSKRTAVPAAILSLMPRAFLRSNFSAGLVEKMIVRADLNRPIAAIGDRERNRFAIGIELDLPILDEHFTWDHDTHSVILSLRGRGGDRREPVRGRLCVAEADE